MYTQVCSQIRSVRVIVNLRKSNQYATRKTLEPHYKFQSLEAEPREKSLKTCSAFKNACCVKFEENYSIY